jgi:hypothetical protein
MGTTAGFSDPRVQVAPVHLNCALTRAMWRRPASSDPAADFRDQKKDEAVCSASISRTITYQSLVRTTLILFTRINLLLVLFRRTIHYLEFGTKLGKWYTRIEQK